MKSFGEIWRSNLFQKWLMAITGLLLVGFLLGHLSGNLLIFMGPEAINEYAHGLRTMLHGAAIWIVRLGLLTSFVLHVTSAITLARRNRAARTKGYAKVSHRTSTMASRSMVYSGLLLLAYVLYHLAHFTWGCAHPELYAKSCPKEACGTAVAPKMSKECCDMDSCDMKSCDMKSCDMDSCGMDSCDMKSCDVAEACPAMKSCEGGSAVGSHCEMESECEEEECIPDVHSMVVASFQQPFIAVLYILAMIMVGLHLNHAIASAVQTLGVRNKRVVPIVRALGPALSVIVALGFSAVPLAVLFGLVK